MAKIHLLSWIPGSDFAGFRNPSLMSKFRICQWLVRGVYTPENPGNTGNLLECEIPTGNAGNILWNLIGPPRNF